MVRLFCLFVVLLAGWVSKLLFRVTFHALSCVFFIMEKLEMDTIKSKTGVYVNCCGGVDLMQTPLFYSSAALAGVVLVVVVGRANTEGT